MSDLDFSQAAAAVAANQTASAQQADASGDLDFSGAARAVAASLPQEPEADPADAQRRVDFLRWRVGNETRSAEEQAEVLRISTALGWAPDLVAADLPKARNAVMAANLNAEEVAKAHPALADFLGDPKTTPIARSDTDRLTGLAKLLGDVPGPLHDEYDPYTGTTYKTYGAEEKATPGMLDLWFRQRALSRGTNEIEGQLLSGKVPAEDDSDVTEKAGSFVDPLAGKASARPLTAEEREGLRAQVQKNKDELEKLKSYGDGVESLSTVPKVFARAARLVIEMGPEIAKGAAVTAAASALGPGAAFAAGTAFWASETAPDLFWQLTELKDPATKKALLSDEEARHYALAMSLPIGALNAVSFEGLGASLTKWKVSKPIAEKVVSLLTRDGVEKILAQKTIPKALASAAFHWGTHVLQGGLMMANQSALSQATLEAAAGQHGVDAPGSVSDAWAGGFASGVKDFFLLSAWGPVRKHFAERGQILASFDSAETLRKINENVADSKTFKLAPSEGARLVAAMGGDKTAYVDREAFDELAQERKVSPRELAAGILGDDGSAYDRATSGNTPLAIPLSKWTEKVVMSDGQLADKLAPNTRLNLEEMTPREAKERMKAIAAEMQERAKERGPSFESEVKGVRDQIFSSAKDVGHGRDQADAFAETLSRHAATAALRFDISVREALIRTGLVQLKLEGTPVLGKLAETFGFTPEEKAAASGHLDQAAFHGSPHIFDKFSLNNIGGGDGTQMYGWGLYFAEHPDVAEYYRTILSETGKEGATYKVDVPENDRLLDHDKPLSEQPPSVLDALGEGGVIRKNADGQWVITKPGHVETTQENRFRVVPAKDLPITEATGGDVLESLSSSHKPEQVSALLGNLGIPGLRYLDKGSRDSAEGTHNFVIWDEKEIRLLEKRVGSVSSELAQKSISLKVPKDSEKRGTISFRVDKAGRAVDFDIRALKGDASTLAHETGHFLSWSLHHLAEKGDAPDGVKADYQALLKFGGWKDAAERLSDNTERSSLGPEIKKLQNKRDRLLAQDKGTAEVEAELAPKLKRRKALETKEEKLSHAWEMYLGEGKAPEAGLVRVFARFRKWMGEVYGSLGGIAKQYRDVYGEDLALSGEVRGVFSRLLAVDNEVEDARAADQRFDVGGVLHFTPEEEARRQEALEKKYEAMGAGLDLATAGYNSEAAKGFLRAERERVRADVHEDVSQSSPYVAMDFFQTGELRDEGTGKVFAPENLPEALQDKDGKPVRLSFEEAQKDAGAETAKLLRKRGLTVDKGGVAAGEVAGFFHFNDAKELLLSLAGAPDKDAVVEQETARRMDEGFGRKMHEIADALSDAGKDASHNAADILHDLIVRNAIAREISAPAKRGGKLPRGALETSAEQIISSSRLNDLSPKFYAGTERTLASEVKELLQKAFRAKEGGRLEEADEFYSDALHKWDSVLLAKTLWRHARDAQNEVAKTEARLKRASKTPWAARLGQGDPTLALADATDSILGPLGFKKGVEGNPSHIDQALALLLRDGAEGVVQDENGSLQSALWDSQLMREVAQGKVAWKDLTVDQARNVLDAIENLSKTARDRNKIRIGNKVLSEDDFLYALQDSSYKLSETNEQANPEAHGALGNLPGVKALASVGRSTARFFRSADASLTETYRILDRLTGGDLNHPAYRFFHDMREEARDAENKLIEKIGQAVQNKWSELPASMRKRVFEKMPGVRDQLPRPETGGIIDKNSPVTRSELWMIALNLGNSGNRERLLKGYGWNDRQVMRVLSEHLSKEEWSWVQGVWDTLGELYPHVEKTHIADTGLRPEKVKAVPFQVTLPSGEVIDMQGGYFPVRYDPRVPMRNGFAGKQAAENITTQIPAFAKPKTAQGATKSRAENAPEGQLYLNFNVVPGHVTQVIHDATHRLWVKQAASVFASEGMQTVLKGRLGQERTAAFGDWIADVANQYRSLGSEATRGMEGFFSWAKSSTTLYAVGANLAVPLADLTNPLLPVIQGDLSPIHLSKVTRQLATRWPEMRAFALENSIELRARKQHGSQLTSLNIPGLTKKGFGGKMEHMAYSAMEASDRITVTPVWLGKYWEALDSNGGDHEAAVSAAEHVVQKYFPASDMSARAGLLRNKGFLGYLTFLYGFGNKVYNINRATIVNVVDKWRDSDTSLKDASLTTAAALGSIAGQAILLGGVGDYLGGHGPKRTQDKAEWVKERALSYMSYNLPIFELMFSGRAALPSSGLFAKAKGELGAVFTGQKKNHQAQGPWESLAALGSFGVAGLAGRPGLGGNGFVRAGQYLDRDFAYDWRRGAYGDVASGLIYGDRGISTLFNPSGE